MAEPRRCGRAGRRTCAAPGASASPEVREGARGAVRLLGAIPIPATILSVDPGRSWTWRVGPATLAHRVHPSRRGGAVVAVDLERTAAGRGRSWRRPTARSSRMLLGNLARVAASPAAR